MQAGAGLELTSQPTAGLTTVGSQLTTQDLQGLFINQQATAYAAQSIGLTADQTANLQIVKREPEDLSHHRKSDTGSPTSISATTVLSASDGGIIISGKQSRHKVNTIFIYFQINNFLMFTNHFLRLFLLARK